MAWLEAVARLRASREPGVLVTVIAVRGHAPRCAGAKMVVSAERTWESVGGGSLEAVAIDRARRLIASGGTEPEVREVALSDKAAPEYGVQCCGGQVTLLLEPLGVVPSVAVFGLGHVGLELVRVLARHDLDLHLVDSRPEQLAGDRLAVLADARARVEVHHEAVLPELVLAGLPPGTHVLVMTHDHAEDAALRTRGLGSIGLIGSAAKWARFRGRLTALGHAAEDVDRITCPIGLAEIAGKDPATIAVSTAAALMRTMERPGDRTRAGNGETPWVP